MGLKRHRPITPGKRGRVSTDYSDITLNSPEKSLLGKNCSKFGRSHGTVSMRRRGGGSKQRYRLIDFKRQRFDIPAKIISIEYDPNRTARIAKILYVDGVKSYILAPANLEVGQIVISGENIKAEVGNHIKMKNIPTGTQIHNIELTPGKGGQIVRSAGQYASLQSKEGKYVTVQLPSKEVRKVLAEGFASIGSLSFPERSLIKLGKAGKKRWLGNRPHVRGVAMAPNAHPHGGGEGRSSVGMPSPKTPWGKPTKGYKTRKPKMSDKLIIKRRK